RVRPLALGRLLVSARARGRVQARGVRERVEPSGQVRTPGRRRAGDSPACTRDAVAQSPPATPQCKAVSGARARPRRWPQLRLNRSHLTLILVYGRIAARESRPGTQP